MEPCHFEVPSVNLVALLEEIMKDTDVWKDADMESVVMYLRGNRHLHVPSEIRMVLGMNKWHAKRESCLMGFRKVKRLLLTHVQGHLCVFGLKTQALHLYICIMCLVGSNFEDSWLDANVYCEMWFDHKFQSSNCERDLSNKHGGVNMGKWQN